MELDYNGKLIFEGEYINGIKIPKKIKNIIKNNN